MKLDDDKHTQQWNINPWDHIGSILLTTMCYREIEENVSVAGKQQFKIHNGFSRQEEVPTLMQTTVTSSFNFSLYSA